jgi:hypothetical protein
MAAALLFFIKEPDVRIELTTFSVPRKCSTTELNRQETKSGFAAGLCPRSLSVSKGEEKRNRLRAGYRIRTDGIFITSEALWPTELTRQRQYII